MNLLLRSTALLIFLTAGSGHITAQKLATKQPQNAADKRLATVDGVPITETQARTEGAAALDSLELQVLKEKASAARNEHRIIEEAVERIIEDKLLKSEAEKQGISKEELMAREVLRKGTEPTAEEIDNFYTANKQRITRPKEEVLPQIGKYLRQQQESRLKEEFFDRLKKEHQVVRMIEPFRYNVNAAGRPSMGPANAPVSLVVFSDFQCPYCNMFSETLKQIMKNYEKKVRLVFRQFPLTNIHASAHRAAEAALCAQDQGHFWEMHDLLFQDQSKLKDEDFKERAAKLGLDAPAFTSCLDSKRFNPQIEEDIKAGAAAGVDGTPALFVNGRFLYGNNPYEEISAALDEELKVKK